MEEEVRGEIPAVRTEPIAAEPGSTEMYEAESGASPNSRKRCGGVDRGGWRKEKKECGRNFRFQGQSLAAKPPYAVIRMCGGVSGGESLRLLFS